MGKKYVNTGKTKIAFGKGQDVLPGDTIELSDEVLKTKAQAIENLEAEGQLTEASKVKGKPEKPEEPEEKPKKK